MTEPNRQSGENEERIIETTYSPPHFLHCQRKYFVRKCSELHRNGINCHTKHHAEYHYCRKYDTLNFCFWHNNYFLSL